MMAKDGKDWLNAFDDLVELGFVTHDVVIGGKTYTLRNLDMDEELMVMRPVDPNTMPLYQSLVVRKMCITRALIKVDGQDVPTDPASRSALLGKLGKMNPSIVNALYDGYVKAMEQANEAIQRMMSSPEAVADFLPDGATSEPSSAIISGSPFALGNPRN